MATVLVAAAMATAPVVRDAKGKKRRPDGRACEAPDCNEFFSSSWYAQNRCCAKADCKRFFGVAGTYQPKKPKKGVLKNAADVLPLADRTNLPVATAAAVQPTAQHAPAPPSAPVAELQTGPPGVGVSGGLALGAALQQLASRFDDGCIFHEQFVDKCECCTANREAFLAVKRAEIAPYRRSLELIDLEVKQATGSVQLSLIVRGSSSRLAPNQWAKHMAVWVTDLEGDDEIFQYEGAPRSSFKVKVERGHTYMVGLTYSASEDDMKLTNSLHASLDVHLDRDGQTRDGWEFTAV